MWSHTHPPRGILKQLTTTVCRQIRNHQNLERGKSNLSDLNKQLYKSSLCKQLPLFAERVSVDCECCKALGKHYAALQRFICFWLWSTFFIDPDTNTAGLVKNRTLYLYISYSSTSEDVKLYGHYGQTHFLWLRTFSRELNCQFVFLIEDQIYSRSFRYVRPSQPLLYHVGISHGSRVQFLQRKNAIVQHSHIDFIWSKHTYSKSL